MSDLVCYTRVLLLSVSSLSLSVLLLPRRALCSSSFLTRKLFPHPHTHSIEYVTTQYVAYTVRPAIHSLIDLLTHAFTHYSIDTLTLSCQY